MRNPRMTPTTRAIDAGFQGIDSFIDTLFRVGLRDASPCGDELREVGSIQGE